MRGSVGRKADKITRADCQLVIIDLNVAGILGLSALFVLGTGLAFVRARSR
jgi:hypothetical protein